MLLLSVSTCKFQHFVTFVFIKNNLMLLWWIVCKWSVLQLVLIKFPLELAFFHISKVDFCGISNSVHFILKHFKTFLLNHFKIIILKHFLFSFHFLVTSIQAFKDFKIWIDFCSARKSEHDRNYTKQTFASMLNNTV